MPKAQQLASAFDKIDLKHIPREQNKDADNLAKGAIKKEQAKAVASSFKLGEESPGSKG